MWALIRLSGLPASATVSTILMKLTFNSSGTIAGTRLTRVRGLLRLVTHVAYAVILGTTMAVCGLLQLSDMLCAVAGVTNLFMLGCLPMYYITRSKYPQRRFWSCLRWAISQFLATAGTAVLTTSIVLVYVFMLASQPLMANLFLPVATALAEIGVVLYSSLSYRWLVVAKRPHVPGDLLAISREEGDAIPIESPYYSHIIPILYNAYMGVSQNYGYLFVGPHNKDYSFFWGLYLGSPYFGKVPYTTFLYSLVTTS